MKRRSNRILHAAFGILLSLLCMAPVVSFSQTQGPTLTASFTQPNVTLKAGEIVSNVLKIVSTASEPVRFKVSLTLPGHWRVMSLDEKIFTMEAKDTMYIPIRIIPSNLKGNSQYFISAVLRDSSAKQRASASFVTASIKQIRWDLNIFPSSRIYFMNNQTSVPFAVNLFNEGNENQDIVLTLSETGKNSILTDSTGLIVKKRFFNLNLDPFRDTTLHFNFSYFEGKRNFRRVDVESHNPGRRYDEKKYSLYFHSQDPKLNGATSFTRNKRIEFIRLNSVKKVSPYNGFVLPVIMDANVYNVLSAQPVMNLVFRGSTLLENGASLVYFTQMNYSSYYYNPKAYQNSSFYLGYYHRWGNVQIGDVSAGSGFGIPASGRGITGEYHITDKQTVGAYFTMSPRLIDPYRVSYGLTYRGIFADKQVLTGTLGHTQDRIGNYSTDFLGARYTFSVTRNHHFSVNATESHSTLRFLPGNPVHYGTLLGFSYSGLYLKEKLVPTVQVDYASRYFSSTNAQRFNYSDRISYMLPGKRSLSLQNNYIAYEMPTYVVGTYTVNRYFNNYLYYSLNTPMGRMMPGLFYNFADQNNIRLHYRGVSFDYNTYNQEKNVRFSFSTRGGYNYLPDYPQVPEFFSMSAYSLMQYHTITGSVRYTYGYQNIYDINTLLQQRIYPQMLYLSLQHQYLFPDPRFVLESNVSYSYQNYNYGHSFGLFPDLYFYTFSGWRFKVSVGYNFNTSMPNRTDLYSGNITTANEQDNKPVVNQGVFVGFGVRKEFGIPIPKKYRKKTNSTVSFVAFIDLNGNRIMDKEEIPLENIVIHVGDHELLTDENGQAKLVNIPSGGYPMSVVSLTDLQGWFPLVDDSLQVSNKTVYLPLVLLFLTKFTNDGFPFLFHDVEWCVYVFYSLTKRHIVVVLREEQHVRDNAPKKQSFTCSRASWYKKESCLY